MGLLYSYILLIPVKYRQPTPFSLRSKFSVDCRAEKKREAPHYAREITITQRALMAPTVTNSIANCKSSPFLFSLDVVIFLS